MPLVQAAAADAEGNLWIATAAGITYVHDPNGEKKRAVRFRGAGPSFPPHCRSPRTGDCWLRPAATRSMPGGRRPGALTLPGERRVAGQKARAARGNTCTTPRVLEDLAIRVLTCTARSSSTRTAW